MCDITPAAELALTLEPQAAGQAREFLKSVSCSVHASRVLDDAELLVSELVTNGVRFGSPPIVLRVECLGEEGMVVAVSDGSPVMPEMQHPEALSESGRGLQLVDWISDSWGVHPESEGKTTWFRLRS